jgi:hypothetical protein
MIKGLGFRVNTFTVVPDALCFFLRRREEPIVHAGVLDLGFKDLGYRV